MLNESTIKLAVYAEMIVVGISIALIFLHATFYSFRRKAFKKNVVQGQAVLSRIGRNEGVEALSEQIQNLPYGVQAYLLTILVRSIGKSHIEPIYLIAKKLGIIRKAENSCKSWFWWKRLQGVRTLTSLGGGENVVPALFYDKYKVIRYQAMDWASQHPTDDVISSLLGILSHKKNPVQFAAKDSLVRMGAAVIPKIISYCETTDNTGLRNALDVAIHTASPSYINMAVRASENEEEEIKRRGVTLLGAIGGEIAVQGLLSNLTAPYSSVRAESAKALGKMGYWRAAPALYPLLSDTDWTTRKEGARTLKKMGSIGILYLKKALSGKDKLAADIALQVLENPEERQLEI